MGYHNSHATNLAFSSTACASQRHACQGTAKQAIPPVKLHCKVQGSLCRAAAGDARMGSSVERCLALPVIRAAACVHVRLVRPSLWKVLHGPRACAALLRSPGCE